MYAKKKRKWRSYKIIGFILLIISMASASSVVQPPIVQQEEIKEEAKSTIIKTYFSDRTVYDHGNGITTVAIGDHNLQAKNGSYFPVRHLVKLNPNGNKLQLTVEDEHYSITPYLNVSGNIISLDNFKLLHPSNDFRFNVFNTRNTYKFALSLNSSLVASFNGNVLFKLQSLNKTDLVNGDLENSHTIDSRLGINYQDLVESGFNIKILNESFLSIDGLSGENVYLDPFIEINASNTGVLEDSYAETTDADEFGAHVRLRVLNNNANEFVSMIKFNLSSLPEDASVQNAALRLFMGSNNLDSGESIEIRPFQVYSPYKIGGSEWIEGTGNNNNGASCTGAEFCYGTRPLPTTNMNASSEESINANLTVTSSTSGNTYYELNVTKMVFNATQTGWTNITMFLNSSLLSGSPTCCGTQDIVEFHSKQGTNNPMLNITYIILPGDLNASLINPSSDISVDQRTYFWFNTSLTCLVRNCGSVFGTSRFNLTGTTPDFAMNSSYNATPFSILDIITTNVNYINNEWNRTYNLGGNEFGHAIVADENNNIYAVGQEFNTEDDWRVQKINGDGVSIWNRTYDLGTTDVPSAIALDSLNNLYIAGWTSTTDWIVMKLNNSGVSVWNRTYIIGQQIQGISIDSNDDIYVVGTESQVDTEWRVQKINSDGVSIWNRTYDFLGFNRANGVDIDSNDDIYVVGINTTTDNDWRIMKLNSTGHSIWNRTYIVGGSLRDITISIKDNIYLAGNNATSDTARIQKLNSTGHSIWNRTLKRDTLYTMNDIVVDLNDNLYAVGTDTTEQWAFTKLLGDNGESVWNRSFDFGGFDELEGVDIDSSGNLYAVGRHGGDIGIMKLNAYHNPTGCGNLDQDEVCDFQYKLNATGTGSYQIAVLFNTTRSVTTENSTSGVNITITVPAVGDSCTYSSGNWVVDCSDNCENSDLVNVDGNNVIITGTGTFFTSADIINYNELIIRGTDSSNICEVTCDGGCFV